MNPIILLLIYLIVAIVLAIYTYVVWFRYDLYMRSRALSDPDPDPYSLREFFRWLMLSKPYQVLMKIFSLLFLLLWLIGIPILFLILGSK